MRENKKRVKKLACVTRGKGATERVRVSWDNRREYKYKNVYDARDVYRREREKEKSARK